MIGLASSYVLGSGMKVYGQFVIDDFQLEALKQIGEGHWLNFYSWQLGWKKYQKLAEGGHLSMRLEYNGARPFMYAHRTPSTNYTHLMYPLLIHGEVLSKSFFCSFNCKKKDGYTTFS